MRIWLLTSELPQEFSGGIARYIENWARVLGETGHEVVIISRTEHPCDTQIARGVRLLGVVPRHTLLESPNPNGLPDTHPAYPYNVLSYWPALSFHMAEDVFALARQLSPPDIIEVQEYGALPYYLLQRKLTERTPLENVPILVHLHSPLFAIALQNHEPRYRFPDYWMGQMEKFCILAADAVLSPSEFLIRSLTQQLHRAFPATRIPYPFMNFAPSPADGARSRSVVYVGRLELRKGVLPLVKACSRLWDRGEDFSLSLVGGDTQFSAKETTVGTFLRQRYAKWVANGRLHFAGQLSHQDVLASMRQAQVVVVPSLWENFPNTCMEAMGSGQVVLASRSGGQAEMISADGVDGFLFDWDTPGDFEQHLRAALALGEEKHRQIGQRAQARMRQLCAPEVILPQRVQHYETVCAQHRARTLFPIVNTFAEEPAPAALERSPHIALEGEQAGLLSVVIPFHNLGDYISETLDTVLASTYSPFEVIIVNDGSTDARSLAALQSIQDRGLAHVRIIHTENQGLATTRNVGAEAVHGEFVTFVDADDLVEPNFFQRAVDVLQRYANVTFVYSWVRYFGESSAFWPTWNAEFPYLLGHNMLSAFAVVRRSAFLRWARNRPDVEYSLEDFEGWIGLLKAGGVGVSLPHPLVHYRIRPGSMYRNSGRDQQLYLYDVISRQHSQAYRDWGVELFNLQNANGPACQWNQPALVGGDDLSSTYVTMLEQQRDKLLKEVAVLGKSWEEHVRFIAAQRAYIEDLEARSQELLEIAHGNGFAAAAANGIVWRDYEIGGRIVSRVRRTWLARQISHSPLLKRVIKRTLRIGRQTNP